MASGWVVLLTQQPINSASMPTPSQFIINQRFPRNDKLQENHQSLYAFHRYRNEDGVADLLSIWSLLDVEPGYLEVGRATELLVRVQPTTSLATRQTMACQGCPASRGVRGLTIFTP